MIIYMSNHGCTENVSRDLALKLGGKVELCNLKGNRNPDFSGFDRLIIGGSIHAGSIQKRLYQFCEKNSEQLIQKELGLFICCMYKDEKATQQLTEAFPEKLHQYAKAEGLLGGELNFEKMKRIEKMVIKKVAKIDHSVNHINHQAIEKFAKKMDKTFSPIFMLI